MQFQGRDLAYRKALRETFAKHGLAKITQKRVIIAPPMEGTKAKDVPVQSLSTAFPPEPPSHILCFQRGVANRQMKVTDRQGQVIDLHTLNKEYLAYKEWLEKRKEMQLSIDKVQDIQGWLARKEDLTELERKVFVRALPPIESFSSIEEETVESSEATKSPSLIYLAKGQARLIPLLRQPLPVALATIDLYCQTNRIRLIDLFTQIDKDKDWSLTRDEIRQIVVETGIPFTLAQIDDLIIALDANNDEELTYQELAIGLEAYKIDSRWVKIKEILSLSREEHQMELEKPIYEAIPVRGRSSSWLYRNSDDSSPRGSPSLDSRGYPSSIDISVPIPTNSSGSLLQVPSFDYTEKVEDSAAKAKEKRSRKLQKKKEKRAKEKKKVEKSTLPLSTMEDPFGQIKNKYLSSQHEQMNSLLDVSHTAGVPLKKELFEKVFLFPTDETVEKIGTKIRQPGLYLMSSLDQQLSDLHNKRISSKGYNSDSDSGKERSRTKSRNKRSIENLQTVDVFWPQSLLDKLRICDDKPVPRDKAHSLFYTVK